MSKINTNYWVLRQNYSEKTDQVKMRELNVKHQFIACPWGGWGNARENVINGSYNEHVPHRPGGRLSRGQDRKFVEEMKIGDIVVIAYAKKKECILARIVSDVDYSINTGVYWEDAPDRISLTETGDIPFSPVGRRIEILQSNFVPVFKPNRMSLTKMGQTNIERIKHLL